MPLSNWPRRRQTLAIAAMVVAALSLAEVALRIWWPQTTRILGKARVYDPAIGPVYIPNAHFSYQMPRRTTRYEISPDGLRDRSIHTVPKPRNTFRILLVGDSFTYGTANQYDEIWPVLLEQQLQNAGFPVDVVKAGSEDYDTHSELLWMQRLVPKYHPDLVVVGFLPNDIFTNEPLQRTTAREQSLQVENAGLAVPTLHLPLFAYHVLTRNDWFYSELYWMTSRKQFFTERQTDRAARQYAITTDLLAAANRYVRSQSSQFAVLSIPQCFQVLAKARNLALRDLSVDSVDRRMGAFAAAEGFPWFPLLDVMAKRYREQGEDLYYREDGHFTPAGNEVAATFLAEQLTRVYGAAIRTAYDH